MHVLPMDACLGSSTAFVSTAWVPTELWGRLRWLMHGVGKRQEQLSTMFSKHAFTAKRKAEGEDADLQHRRKGHKPQRRQEGHSRAGRVG